MKPSSSATRKSSDLPVLIVQHAPHEHPAILRRALETQGIPSIWIHAYLGESYPSHDEIQGIISLGGPMGANDELLHPWISPECKIMAQCVEFSKPVVGVCLGGQMLSRALGGEVVRNRSAEVGWFPIEINSEGENDRILGNVGASPLVYHWQYDTFSLPPGSTLLAHSFACERQAYRIGENAYGFQFHPEADHQLILEWLAVDGVENEIEDTRREHGITTVQDAETQRSRAEQGEKSSLRIATALSQLFKNRDYPGKKSDLHARLDLWIPNRTALEIEFNNSNGDPVVLQGHVTMLFEIPDGEFLIFTENSTLRWPIRLDFIRKIKPAG